MNKLNNKQLQIINELIDIKEIERYKIDMIENKSKGTINFKEYNIFPVRKDFYTLFIKQYYIYYEQNLLNEVVFYIYDYISNKDLSLYDENKHFFFNRMRSNIKYYLYNNIKNRNMEHEYDDCKEIIERVDTLKIRVNKLKDKEELNFKYLQFIKKYYKYMMTDVEQDIYIAFMTYTNKKEERREMDNIITKHNITYLEYANKKSALFRKLNFRFKYYKALIELNNDIYDTAIKAIYPRRDVNYNIDFSINKEYFKAFLLNRLFNNNLYNISKKKYNKKLLCNKIICTQKVFKNIEVKVYED